MLRFFVVWTNRFSFSFQYQAGVRIMFVKSTFLFQGIEIWQLGEEASTAGLGEVVFGLAIVTFDVNPDVIALRYHKSAYKSTYAYGHIYADTFTHLY